MATQRALVHDLRALRWAELVWTLECTATGRLPRWLGSTLRGAWAWALRRTGCALRCEEPTRCMLRARCPYAVCFETPLPPGADRLRSLRHLPHPLVLLPPQPGDAPSTWRPGDQLVFRSRLFGRAMEHFPYLLVAADKMAASGLGRDRVPFRLASAAAWDGARRVALWPCGDRPIPAPPAQHLGEIPSPPQAVAVRFVTPTRLVEQGRVVAAFSFRTLVRAALSRLSAMLAFHCDATLDVDFSGILHAAQHEVRLVERAAERVRLHRWSNRQQRRVGLDGVVGRIAWEGPGVARAWPFLWAARITHVGKATIFGLGAYEVEALG